MKTKVFICLFLYFLCNSSFAQWTYSSKTDEMSGKTNNFARLKSNNSLNLSFPYQGKNFGEIIIRKFGGVRQSVVFSIDKGQILCHETPCLIEVKFDDSESVLFKAVASDDFDQTIVFLWQSDEFIAAVKSAKLTRIKLPLFQNGEQILRFTAPKPLIWEPPTTQTKQ